MTTQTTSTPGLFITGTDTGVGKTHLALLICRELRAQGVSVGAYKPACSGAAIGHGGGPVWDDVERLAEAIGGRSEIDRICPQRFLAPLAPPVAARIEDRSVDPVLLRAGVRWWQGRVDVLLVEGVGGLLCPLTETETVADFAADLGYPLLVVARARLGTINHTLLTVEAARTRGLPVAGIVLNETAPGRDDPSTASNPDEIAARSGVPVLGAVACGQTRGLHRGGRLITMDWRTLAGPSSP